MTKDVLIDGVLYVPANQAMPTLEDIARAILDEFYGYDLMPLESGPRTIEDLSEGISVRIYDDDDGEPWDEFWNRMVKRLTGASDGVAPMIREIDGARYHYESKVVLSNMAHHVDGFNEGCLWAWKAVLDLDGPEMVGFRRDPNKYVEKWTEGRLHLDDRQIAAPGKSMWTQDEFNRHEESDDSQDS